MHSGRGFGRNPLLGVVAVTAAVAVAVLDLSSSQPVEIGSLQDLPQQNLWEQQGIPEVGMTEAQLETGTNTVLPLPVLSLWLLIVMLMLLRQGVVSLRVLGMGVILFVKA